MLKTRTLLTTLAATTALAAPATAGAATYQVSSCDWAGGAQNAWSPASNHPQMTAYSVCPSLGDFGRGIVVRNGIAGSTYVIGQGGSANQSFTAPGGTAITNVRFSGQIFRAAGQRWNVGLTNGYQVLLGVDGSSTYALNFAPSDFNVAVPGNQTVYWEVSCVASSGCDAKSTGDASTHYVRAGVWIHSTVVTIDDPTVPNLAWRGSLLTGSWVRGDRIFDWDANDNSGISSTSATIGGRTIISQNEGCDYSRPQPCPGGASGNTTISTSGWPDGGHSAHIETRDAAGNVNSIDGAVYIDNNAPARATSPAVDGGEGWRTTNSFRITWNTPGGQAAPITARHYSLCPTDGGACTTGTAPGGGADITLSVPRAGAWRTQVWLQDAAGNTSQSNASDPVTLRFDDTTPPATTIGAPDGPIGDSQARGLPTTLTLAAGTSAPPSGIAGYSVTTNGTDPDGTIDTNSSWTTAELAEGTQTLKARAISGSGKPGAIATKTLSVDRTAPTADATGLPDPGIWQDQPVTSQLTAQDKQTGIAAIEYQLDTAPTQTAPGEKAPVTISEDGKHTLTWEAIDKAGNHSRPQKATIRIDRTGPDTVDINPTNPNSPTKITATATDKGSGINSGLIQIRPASGGAWRDLDTTLEPGNLTAQLDDVTLTDGSYQLRATATDNVGNTRASSPATIELPLRAQSRVVLTSSPSSRTVTGRILDQDGKPLPRARLTIQARSRTEKTWRNQSTETAGKTGTFRYRIPTGPSRTIRFTYTGTETIKPASVTQTVLTKASSTIRASRRHAALGQTIRFSGRLTGRPIPPEGKVLELQAYDSGRWRSFPQVVTTTRDGRWTTTLKFERTSGTYTYRIRARIFRDGSYPYETGVSRTVRLTVHGN